jgi:hypothetical protein
MNLPDKVVNTLLSLLLLVVFSLSVVVPIFLGFAVLRFAERALWPHIADRLARFGPPEDVLFCGLIALCCCAIAIRFLRKRYWANAFLSLGILVTARWQWSADSRPSIESGLRWALPLVLLLLIPACRRIARWEFLLVAVLIALAATEQAGKLGAGALARFVTDGEFLVLLAWFVYRRYVRGEDLFDSSASVTDKHSA